MTSAEQSPQRSNGANSTAASVVVSFPGRPEYLRLVRLAAADAGARAGLSLEDLENLRIAVDELTYAIMGERGADEVTLRYSSADGVVEIQGECASAPSDQSLALSDLARSIVGAIVDEHDIGIENGMRTFHLVKHRRV